MVRTPVRRKPEREVPEDIIQFMENELYDAELEEEKNPGDKQAAQDVEFLTSLQSQMESTLQLSSRQEVMVRRMMRRNKMASVPPITSRERKIAVEVCSVKVEYKHSHFGTGGKRLVATFFVFDAIDREIIFKLWEGSKAFKAAKLQLREEGDEVLVVDYPDHLKISGTVTWSRPGRFGLKQVRILS